MKFAIGLIQCTCLNVTLFMSLTCTENVLSTSHTHKYKDIIDKGCSLRDLNEVIWIVFCNCLLSKVKIEDLVYLIHSFSI